MTAYTVPVHVWRTADNRLVLSGHPDAAILAYPTGTELAEDDARRRGIIDAVDGRPDVPESAPKPQAKPGLTINRASKEKP